MIPIIESNTFANRLGKGLIGAGQAFGQQYVQNLAEKESERKLQEENLALSKLGMDLSGITSPDLRKQLAVEQLRGEVTQKKSQNKLEQNRKIISDIEKRYNLEPGSLSAYENVPEMAARIAKPIKGKEPALTEKPVPLEISSKINEVLEKNPEATADQLRSAMDKAGIPPVYSNPYTENRRREEERISGIKTQKIQMAQSRDNEILKSRDELRDSLPIEEAALNSMDDAILSGDQSFFSPNNLAESTGLEWFRDAAGGQFKTAGKTFLINNVSKFGARPNQYIEQQMADSLAKVGRSRAANMITMQALRFDSDIKKELLKITDDVEEEGIYKPGQLGKTVQGKMKNYVEDRQNQLTEKVKFIKNHQKEIDETPKGHIPMIDPTGELVYIPEEEIGEALFHGAISI